MTSAINTNEKNGLPELPVFVNINTASKASGLSVFFIRAGVKAGTIAHLKSGKKFLINLPRLLETLDQESKSRTRLNI